MGGDHTGPVDREFDKPFFYGGGSNADRRFSNSGYGQLGELTGPVGEFVFIAIVEEDEFKGFQTLVLGLDGNFIDTDRVG
jgi:hypothetical protein